MAMKLLLIVAFSLMMAWVVARSAPAAIIVEYRLCSYVAGKYVHVDDNGTITANGSPRSSSVFITYSKNDRVQFELKSKPGMFLMLKELNHSIADVDNNTTSLPMNVTTVVHEYALVLDYPSEPYLTEWEKSTTSGALVQKVDDNTTCSISFDSSGNVAGPCNLETGDIDSITLSSSIIGA